jgi:hypothetical protein
MFATYNTFTTYNTFATYNASTRGKQHNLVVRSVVHLYDRSFVRTIYIIFITRSQRSQRLQCSQRLQRSQRLQHEKRPLAASNRKRLLNRTLARAHTHTHTPSTAMPDVKILSNLGGKSKVLKKQFGKKNKLIIWH